MIAADAWDSRNFGVNFIFFARGSEDAVSVLFAGMLQRVSDTFDAAKSAAFGVEFAAGTVDSVSKPCTKYGRGDAWQLSTLLGGLLTSSTAPERHEFAVCGATRPISCCLGDAYSLARPFIVEVDREGLVVGRGSSEAES